MAITSRVTTTKAKLSSQNTTKGIIKMAGIQ
ncbi:MAG TPA: acyltransferase, partial [Methylotenera mobilis]|nr:acyltransferase [Methylotenera mobilis]